MAKDSVEEIDKQLPQAQCGLCHYAGCLPYAEAIATNQAPINRCLPGGVVVLEKLGALMGIETKAYLPLMQEKQKSPSVALIDESLCIGCVKCINACPVDAIIGAPKLMHTVFSDACTGCGLCVPVCPMDCIIMQPLPAIKTEAERQAVSDKARRHFYRRQQRLQNSRLEAKTSYQEKMNVVTKTIDPQKAYIQAALLRVQQKKQQEKS